MLGPLAARASKALCLLNPDANITLTMGIRLAGFVAPFAFEGATTGEAFLSYVEHQLVSELRPGDVAILGNLGGRGRDGPSPG